MKNINFIVLCISVILISLYLAIDKRNIEGLTIDDKTVDNDKTSNKGYELNNYDITYHIDPSTNKNDNNINSGVGEMWVKDNSGVLISVPYSDVKNTTLYYETGSYPFGPSSYVPNYGESTLLSEFSNKTNSSSIYTSESSIIDREQKCNQIDSNTCGSTNCCVLLGGQKCVAGDENGPSIKSNYSDFLITNRDYYYYQGKCYGNC
jgi:hypothetical protein